MPSRLRGREGMARHLGGTRVSVYAAPMEITTIKRPDFDGIANEGSLRTTTFAWLLQDVVPQGKTMLDLGCGPCVFARRGVKARYLVTAVDGRTDRVPDDLDTAVIAFVHEDVRDYPAGNYDVVTVLGLLYHLELDDQIALLKKYNYSTVILDTQVHFPQAVTEHAGPWAQNIVERDGYEGVQFPEGDNPMASIGNPASFWHTEPSLLRMIEAAGFSSCTIVDPLYASKYGARKFYVLNLADDDNTPRSASLIRSSSSPYDAPEEVASTVVTQTPAAPERKSVVQGLGALRRDNPWPPALGADPFYLALDAGGRHLVTSVLPDNGVMVEIGAFLGGSTRQWLDASPGLTVIAVDPWDGNWGPYVRGMAQSPWMARHVAGLDAEAVADLIEGHGNYAIALNNLRGYRDRVIPVRRFSPEALHYLHARGIRPDVIYIDAFKEVDDLTAAWELFPNAVICGDDWNWRDEQGVYRMQQHVTTFAEAHSLRVEADAATWLLRG